MLRMRGSEIGDALVVVDVEGRRGRKGEGKRRRRGSMGVFFGGGGGGGLGGDVKVGFGRVGSGGGEDGRFGI